MIQPKTEQIRAIAAVTVSNPRFVEWLTIWAEHELSTLPTILGNTQVAQGRCQVLQELVKLLKDAPNLAAQP